MKKFQVVVLPALLAVVSLSLMPGIGAAADATTATPAKPAKSASKPAAKAAAKPKEDKKPAAESAETVSTIPDDVLEQMNKLVVEAVQLASPSLQKGDEFPSYGVLQLKDGSLKAVSWQKPNPPKGMVLFRQIYYAMRTETQRNPDVIAGVTIAPAAENATTNDGKSVVVHGIRAEVDHRQGAPRLVFLPYTREDGKIVFGSNLYQAGSNPLFEHPAPAPAAPAPAPAPAAAPAKP